MYKGCFYYHEKNKPLIRKYDIRQDKYFNLTVPNLNATNSKNLLYTTK